MIHHWDEFLQFHTAVRSHIPWKWPDFLPLFHLMVSCLHRSAGMIPLPSFPRVVRTWGTLAGAGVTYLKHADFVSYAGTVLRGALWWKQERWRSGQKFQATNLFLQPWKLWLWPFVSKKRNRGQDQCSCQSKLVLSKAEKAGGGPGSDQLLWSSPQKLFPASERLRASSSRIGKPLKPYKMLLSSLPHHTL